MRRLCLLLATVILAGCGEQAKAACSFEETRTIETTKDVELLALLLSNTSDYVTVDGCDATSLAVRVTWSGTVLVNDTLNIQVPNLDGTLYNHTLTLSITGEDDAIVDGSLIEYAPDAARFIQFWGDQLGRCALDYNYHVTVILKDLVVDGFKNKCNGWAPGGAIMLDYAASLQVDGCEFRNNIGCNAGGGAIFMRSTVVTNDALVLTLQSSTFYNNRAWNGAGVMLMGKDANSGRIKSTVDSCTFVGNTAYLDKSDASGGNGGGLKIHNNAAVNITNSSFNNNRADGNGGGLYANQYTTWVVENTMVNNNTAGNSGGGAHFQISGKATFRNVVLSSNMAIRDGGGSMYARDIFNVTWDNVTVEDNTAGYTGAGVGLVALSTLLATDCQFINNVVSTGALIFLLSGSVMNSTRVDYLAGTAGSTMYAVYAGPSAQFRALESTFEGWNGDYAILHIGELMVLDSCVFDTENSNLVVSLDTADISPAVIRNAIVSTSVFEKSGFSDSLSDNVISCSSSVGASGCNSGCLDQPLGVSCLCYTPALTEESSCLTGNASVELSVSKYPQDASAPAIGSYGNTPEGYVTVKHSSTAAGAVRWSLITNDTTWNVVPEAGLLAQGGSVEVLISQLASEALNGVTHLALVATGETFTNTAISEVSTVSAFFECPAGFFFNDTDKSAESLCVQCSLLPSPDGVDCTKPGNVLSSLTLEPAWWRSGAESTDVLQCFNPSACSGGPGSDDEYCATGYEGPFCGVCAPHYGKSAANRCRPCEGDAHVIGAAVAMLVVGLLMLTLGVGILAFLLRDDIAAPQTDGEREPGLGLKIGSGCRTRSMACFRRLMAHAQRAPLYKLRIPIVVYQIVTLFVDVTSTQFPRPYADFLRGLSFINFSFTEIFAATCVVKVDFYTQLLLATLPPLGLLALLSLTYATAVWRVRSLPPRALHDPDATTATDPCDITREKIEAIRSKHIMVVVLVAFLIYSYVSTTVFQTFACVEAGGVEYLRADLELFCHTPRHKMFTAFAAVMVIVYPIGIPVLFLAVVMRQRERSKRARSAARAQPVAPRNGPKAASQNLADRLSLRKRHLPPLSAGRGSADWSSRHSTYAGPDAASALRSPYREERYWFESIECLRRVMLTGVLVFARPGEPLQAGVGCVMSVIFLALFAYLQPFRDVGETTQYTLGFLIICFTMLQSLFIKSGLVDNTSSSQKGFAALLCFLNIFVGLAALVQIWLYFPREEEAKEAKGTKSTTISLSGAQEERKEDVAAAMTWAPVSTTPTRGGGGTVPNMDPGATV